MHTTEVHTSAPRNRRREHTAEFKESLVQKSLQPGTSVSALALQNGLNANLLFAWRRAYRRRQTQSPAATSSPAVLPVCIVAESSIAKTDPAVPRLPEPASQTGQHILRPTARSATTMSPAASTLSTLPGHIELHIGSTRLKLHGRVDEPTLRLVLQLIHTATPIPTASPFFMAATP